ncbi:hypothetical protein [Nocardia carnea]|uniref:hypothetical protein n=1 Tax=Nocardia carnea TaxID=37328 RepID=UPI0024584AB5|nr:hypothetical protein [Nocardia carnea]
MITSDTSAQVGQLATSLSLIPWIFRLTIGLIEIDRLFGLDQPFPHLFDNHVVARNGQNRDLDDLRWRLAVALDVERR